MINAMRTLALDYLFDKLGDKDSPPQNLEEWYHKLRTGHPERLFPFLVEDVSNIEKVYILYPDRADFSMVNMEVEDITVEKARKLPFKQYRARAIGPVIKRSKTKDGVSPNSTTQHATLKYFKNVGQSLSPWANYFKEISEILDRPNIKALDGNVTTTGKDTTWPNIYSAALDLIPSAKGTVMVTVADRQNKWPGERAEYLCYLTNELPLLKYSTGKTPVKDNQTCPLCGAPGVTVFPNALAGADINISNVDRVGAFPGIDIAQAWKGYALCNACADLLYVYKSHFLKKDKNSRNPFITNIAGDNAIIIPSTTLDYNARGKILRRVNDLVRSSSSSTEEVEIDILDILKDEKAILNLTFLWATAGQEIDKVTGMITNVPPSRLTELSKVNEESDKWKHPLFPEIMFFSDKRINFHPDLSLRALKTLFYRPDASMKLHRLKKAIAASVYHKTEIPSARFWEEVITTAQRYWLDAIQNESTYGLLNEGKKKTGESYLTAAGWIRHLCWWIYYFKRLGVMKMGENFYEPHMEQLKPYFGPESGIDSNEKFFAFLLGVVFGRLLFAQSEAGVRLSALKWVKRFTISGEDLPELFKKIIAKILEYQQYGNEKVVKLLKTTNLHQIIEELSFVGKRLGDRIELSSTLTCYYFLLGQSLSNKILKT